MQISEALLPAGPGRLHSAVHGHGRGRDEEADGRFVSSTELHVNILGAVHRVHVIPVMLPQIC